MKTFSLFILLSCILQSQLQAASVSPFSASAGGYVATGAVYLDADGTGDGSFSLVQGIANITQIRNANGELVWTNNDSDLNIIFSDFGRDLTATGLGDNGFASTGGQVGFYQNSAGTFNPTGDFAADAALLNQGELKLGAVGASSNETGHTATGTATDLFYSSNGFLSVENGAWAALLDTNAFGFADMAFNISASSLNTAGYSYAGSGDITGEVSAVPIPAAFWLFGSALLSVGLLKQKK